MAQRSTPVLRAVQALQFNADGATLASLTGGTITLWDIGRQRPQSTLRWGKRRTLHFRPDGQSFAAAGQDGTVTLWDLTSRQLLGTLKGQHPAGGDSRCCLHARRDNDDIGSPGGGLMLWDLTVSGWIKTACAVVRRDLTKVEWEGYVGSGSAARVCGSDA